MYGGTTICLPILPLNDIWDVFQIGAIMNIVSINIHVQVFMLTYVFIFLGQVTVSGIVVLYG